MGIKQIDEQLKSAFALVHDVVAMRKNVEKVILDLCDECSLPESANMAQCLRIITLRLASCATIINYKVQKSEYGVSDKSFLSFLVLKYLCSFLLFSIHTFE